VDGDGPKSPSGLARAHVHEEGVAIPPVPQSPAVLHDAVDVERDLQVDLHGARGAGHPVGDSVPPPHRAVGRIQRHVKVVEHDVPPRALRGDAAAKRVGMSELGLLRRRSRGADQCEEEAEQGQAAGTARNVHPVWASE
jgi:hypothetical protein